MILSISEHIYSVLASSQAVASLVGGRIYPIATKTEVDFPFIVYERDSVEVSYDKALRRQASTDATVYVLAATHDESLAIAEAVVDALDKREAEYTGFDVTDAWVTGAVESFVEQTYIQQISFRFQINEK